MTLRADFQPDDERANRTGLDEAVFCESKNIDQIERIVLRPERQGQPQLLTRLNPQKYSALSDEARNVIDYEEVSRTGIVGDCPKPDSTDQIAVVAAGTSDVGVAREAVRTLAYHGRDCSEFYDVGVAGLWRILGIEDQLRQMSIVVVVAGMDAALPTVVAGLTPSSIIAVPTSVGYGVAQGGRSALETILSSCSPGVVTVNIDNGFGAACAAIRIMNQIKS
ncbi:MAG: nickel pincer cofactor biosynthesis protein LarB [Acidiferrobacterales bacterium]|nr:nickel pincer cofactor biosynthesis protein LarB [Acidiferrobacterales bacterium]